MFILKFASIQNWLEMVTVMMKATIFIAPLMEAIVVIHMDAAQRFVKNVNVSLDILMKKLIMH